MSLFAKLGDFMKASHKPVPPPSEKSEPRPLEQIVKLQRAIGTANRRGDHAEAERLGRELEALL